MDEENREKNWFALPNKKKKDRIERVCRILKKVADEQLSQLEDFKKSKNTIKTERHRYFFTIVESFWDDAEFALALGKNKYKHYAIYPARTIMEKFLKIEWFSNIKTTKDQDLITKKELMMNCLLSYRNNKDVGRSTVEFENYYKQFNDVGLPEIGKVKIIELKAFPDYEEMCKKSKLKGASILYKSYRDLSGLPHGNLLTVFTVQNGGKDFVYIQAMYNVARFCIEMLRITDFHLGYKTKKEVENAIKKSEELTFRNN